MLSKHCYYIAKKLEDDSSLHSWKKLALKIFALCLIFFCPTIVSCLITNSTNKLLLTAVPWTTQFIALLLLIYAWKRSKNQQFLPPVLLEKCGDSMLLIAFALLRKPSRTYLTVWILTSPLLSNLRTMANYYFLIL